MKNNNISFQDFSENNFYNIFINKYNSLKIINNNIRCKYLYEYLDELDCKKILIENEYIDKDYLMDYQDFYVRCFKPYSKICKRAHFFSLDLDEKYMENIVASAPKFENLNDMDELNILRNNYLGFSVIKRLPEKVVGKTCLKTFNEDGGKRKYYVVQPYYSNINGLEFQVSSLAFQEQDSIMAACATISLWCAFQKTSKMFNHYLPSPGEITRDATRNFLGHARIIPSKGLQVEQIVESIRQVGLTYEVQHVNELVKNQFLGYAHSYLKTGLPIILILAIPTTSGNFDLHAVTITGYRLENSKDTNPINEINLFSDNITELYVHDDQMGPFSRIHVKEIDKKFKNEFEATFPNVNLKLDGPLLEFENPYGPIGCALPIVMIIPLYHKIRINFSSILDEINRFNNIFRQGDTPFDLKWDIHLANSNIFKSNLLINNQFSDTTKKRILQKCLPKYIWRCIATIDEKKTFMELISDSTDITSKNSFIEMVLPDSVKKILQSEYPEIIKKNTQEIEKSNIPNIIELLEDTLEINKKDQINSTK